MHWAQSAAHAVAYCRGEQPSRPGEGDQRGSHHRADVHGHARHPGRQGRATSPGPTRPTSRSRASTGSTTRATGSTRRTARSSASSTPRTARPRRGSTARPTASRPTRCTRSKRAADRAPSRQPRDRRPSADAGLVVSGRRLGLDDERLLVGQRQAHRLRDVAAVDVRPEQRRRDLVRLPQRADEEQARHVADAAGRAAAGPSRR